jgi:hypothetical protein
MHLPQVRGHAGFGGITTTTVTARAGNAPVTPSAESKQARDDLIRSTTVIVGYPQKRSALCHIGWNGVPFGREIRAKWVMRQGAQTGDDALSVKLGSGERGVGMRVAE